MNIAKILKNVPAGTKLYSPAFGEVTLKNVNVYNDEISIIDSTNIVRSFYNNGNFYKGGEIMLFPSRENRDWSTFPACSFNEGDILISENGNPFILKRVTGSTCEIYCGIDCLDKFWKYNDSWTIIKRTRRATEEEIELFFERIKKEGYKWNPETFNLEKIGKFNINTLKPFDKVLVRDMSSTWRCGLYSHYRNEHHYKYACSSGAFYQCVPYNDDTKHLVGTDKDCPEYYKTW